MGMAKLLLLKCNQHVKVIQSFQGHFIGLETWNLVWSEMLVSSLKGDRAGQLNKGIIIPTKWLIS